MEGAIKGWGRGESYHMGKVGRLSEPGRNSREKEYTFARLPALLETLYPRAHRPMLC